MTKQHILKEETLEPEFNVYETLPVYKYLDRIYACNKDKYSAVEEFKRCLSTIKHHLSYRCMALGYPDNVTKISNQIMKFNELGITVTYESLPNDNNHGECYVNIIRIDVDFNYFGLTKPMPINRKWQRNESLQRKCVIKESQLRWIIRETICRVLNETISRQRRRKRKHPYL